MRLLFLLTILSVMSTGATAQKMAINKPQGHSMLYYVSLPEGWTANRAWPILLILESANKEFEKNAQRFVDARKDLPFIIVAPVNVNNGNMGRRDPSVFPYSAATWDEIEKTGDCKFNMEGILTIVNEVRKKYNGEPKIYVTAFEAGAHALWPLVFQHPEIIKTAIPVAGNYNQRTCLDQPASTDATRSQVNIKAFYGSEDEHWGPRISDKATQYVQYENAKKFAIDHGFTNISEMEVKGKGHEPLVEEVMAYLKTQI